VSGDEVGVIPDLSLEDVVDVVGGPGTRRRLGEPRHRRHQPGVVMTAPGKQKLGTLRAI